MAKDWSRERWWPGLVGCIHSAAVDSCRCLCSGGARCRYTYSGGDQGRRGGSGPTVGSLAAAEALAAGMLSQDCTISPWVYALQRMPVTGTGLGFATGKATGEYDIED